MESTASPEPPGRDVGPFHGVTTLRVHGGYEICRGTDDEGRQVTILTMGPSAAESQPLRDTLIEAYDYVRRAGTPQRETFLDADLHAEQPWIVSLDGPGGSAGVRRLFDRLVRSVRPPAPGRQTGTLPRAADSGQIPRVSDTGQIPRVTDRDPRHPQAGQAAGGHPPAYPATRGGQPGHPGMPPPHRPPNNGPHTGQIPRVVDQPGAGLRAPTRAQPGPPQGPPTAGPPPVARELATAPPPMPAYQGRLYTAAPRPIAPPPASALPAHPGPAGHGPLPIVLVALGVIVLGALVLLVVLYLEMGP